MNSQYCDFEIELKEMDFNKLSKTVRYNIKKNIEKAEKKLIIEYSTDIDKFYELYVKTMHFLGTPQLSRDYFTKLTDSFKWFLIVAKLKNKIIHSSLFICFRNCCKWENSVYELKYKNLQANSLILWEGIKRAKALGYNYFLLGRTLINSNCYNFKKGWGREISFNLYKMFYSLEEKKDLRLTWHSKLASRLWKRTPAFITNRIGVPIRKAIGV